ncbi:hypothetical protein RAA17_08100 [Komagataeibacter rhaeticus]|nr:hypothetical protein [Komagataeibacter rhaeticus]
MGDLIQINHLIKTIKLLGAACFQKAAFLEAFEKASPEPSLILFRPGWRAGRMRDLA